MTGITTDLPRRPLVVRNALLLERLERAVDCVLRHRGLGLLAGVNVTIYNGIQAQISQTDERPVDGLLGWFYLLDQPEIQVKTGYSFGDDEAAQLVVSGRLHGVPASAWAWIFDVSAIAQISERRSVHALRCLQIEGAW